MRGSQPCRCDLGAAPAEWASASFAGEVSAGLASGGWNHFFWDLSGRSGLSRRSLLGLAQSWPGRQWDWGEVELGSGAPEHGVLRASPQGPGPQLFLCRDRLAFSLCSQLLEIFSQSQQLRGSGSSLTFHSCHT